MDVTHAVWIMYTYPFWTHANEPAQKATVGSTVAKAIAKTMKQSENRSNVYHMMEANKGQKYIRITATRHKGHWKNQNHQQCIRRGHAKTNTLESDGTSISAGSWMKKTIIKRMCRKSVCKHKRPSVRWHNDNEQTMALSKLKSMKSESWGRFFNIPRRPYTICLTASSTTSQRNSIIDTQLSVRVWSNVNIMFITYGEILPKQIHTYWRQPVCLPGESLWLMACQLIWTGGVRR